MSFLYYPLCTCNELHLLSVSSFQNGFARTIHSTSRKWCIASSFHRHGLYFKGKWFLNLAGVSDNHQGNFNRKSKQKYEFDAIQDLIQSSPSKQKDSKGSNDQKPGSHPTRLEREALAIVGSPNFSLRDRADAMNGLLDLLEQKGVSTAYAFEFIRYAGKLIDELIREAKQCLVDQQIHEGQGDPTKDMGKNSGEAKQPEGPRHVKEPLVLFERKPGFGLEDQWGVLANPPLTNRVYVCAERRGVARLVAYFQVLNMKAADIPKLIPFAGRRIDVVMAKAEFLRSIGVKSQHLPSVLASWPQLLSHECDDLASVVEYLKSIGLTHKEIVAIIVKHPEVLGQNVELGLQKIVTFLEEIGSSLKDAKILISRHPSLLLQDVKGKLGLLVDYLVSAGIQKKHIGPLFVRRPVLINSDTEKDLLPVIDYLKSLNATADDIDKIITSFPGLFCYDLEKDFRPAVSQLESVGVDPSLMGKIFRRHPQLLKNRMNFGSKVQFLLRLGLEKEDLGRTIYNAPQLLGLREEKLLPTVKFLEKIGVKGSSLRKVLKLKPMVLAYSVEAKLQPNVNFLQSLGINQLDIGKLVTRHPQLLTLSVEKNLEPTVSYLLVLGFTRGEIADMLRRLPSLLGFSVTNVLQPKYTFFIEVIQRSPKELVTFPQYFSYSLDKRIIPRFISLGVNNANYSLSSIYGCGDLVFEEKLSRWNSNPK